MGEVGSEGVRGVTVIGCDNWREIYAEMVKGSGQGIYIMPWAATAEPKVILCRGSLYAVLLTNGELYAMECDSKVCRPLALDTLEHLYNEMEKGEQAAMGEESVLEPSSPAKETSENNIEDLFGEML